MTLGQPDTPEERAAEQARYVARDNARRARDARIRREVAEDLACGNTYEASTASVARRHNLGKGATRYVRSLTADLDTSS